MKKDLRVLLVEDSEDDAELLYLELMRGGFKATIERVETAEEFSEQLETAVWDLVVSDFNLPSFNAPAALEIFTQHGIDVPFIICSGAVVAKDAVSLLKAGASDFLEKGDLARLIPAIERELREVETRKERRRAENTLKKLFRAVDQSPVSVMITDQKGRVEYVNQCYLKSTGYELDEILGFLPDVMNGDFVSLEQNAEVWDAVHSGKDWRGEFCNQRKNGEMFWEYVTVAPIHNDNGDLTNLLISKEDITYRKDAEEKLYRQANYDDLTQLPNRILLLDRLGQALERSKVAALVAIDLDNFKKVNDSLGHHVGDELLKLSAERLRQSLSLGQTVGRVSGDEFSIVLPELTDVHEVESLMSKIFDAFSQPMKIQGHEIFTTLSAGVTMYPEDGDDPGLLFKNSEAAMRRAKEDGRNGFKFFTAHMNERAEERLELETGLRRALENEELRLFFQPIICNKRGVIAGAEALIRWIHPEKGIIPPDEFISLAEETGLIIPIGKWVIDEACRALHEIRANGLADAYVAINVSPQQVWSNALISDLREAIDIYKVPKDGLVVEVTESVCLQDNDMTLGTLHEVSRMGVKLAVDDFGTGYSSLSYLKRYPFDILKIDRTFVRDIPEDSDDVALVDAMVAMGHSLGLRIVAEGVENAAQVALLQNRKCDLLQGYHFSKPVELNEFLSQKNDVIDSA